MAKNLRTIARITIDYNFGKSKDGKDVISTMINTNDDLDIFSKDRMKQLKEIQIVTAKGEITGVIGSKPPHILSAEARKKPVEIKDMFIDIGAKSRAEVEEALSRL